MGESQGCSWARTLQAQRRASSGSPGAGCAGHHHEDGALVPLADIMSLALDAFNCALNNVSDRRALMQDALDITMKMALSVPLADIMAYRKVGKAFFGLLDVLCSNHTHVIANYGHAHLRLPHDRPRQRPQVPGRRHLLAVRDGRRQPGRLLLQGGAGQRQRDASCSRAGTPSSHP